MKIKMEENSCKGLTGILDEFFFLFHLINPVKIWEATLTIKNIQSGTDPKPARMSVRVFHDKVERPLFVLKIKVAYDKNYNLAEMGAEYGTSIS